MLDQVGDGPICQSMPNGSGRGHRVPRLGLSKMRVTSRLRPGTAPTPHAVDSSTSRFTRVGWPTASCWAIGAAVGEPDDIRFLNADGIEDPCSDI